MKKKVIISLIVCLVLVAGICVIINVVKAKQTENVDVKKSDEIYTVDNLEFGDKIRIDGSSVAWVYIGKTDEERVKAISSTCVGDTLTLNGESYVNAVNMLNSECEKLYSVGEYLARSVNVEDINEILNYDGIKGEFIDATVNPVECTEPLSIAELESRTYGWLSYRKVPEGSVRNFKEYLSNFYTYMGSKYASKATEKYSLVFTDEEYWLASIAAEAYFDKGYVEYIVRSVGAGMVNGNALYISDGTAMTVTCNLRPVIELEADVKFIKEDNVFVVVE